MYPIRTFTDDQIATMKTFRSKKGVQPILYDMFLNASYKKLSEYIPAGIMPNQITIFGLLSMCVSMGLTLYFNPRLNKVSRKLAAANFVLLFLYFSADFLDGLHAVRTNQCSQMGEIMDHGTDSIATGFIVLTLGSSLRLGLGTLLLFLAYQFFLGFYMCGLTLKYTRYFILGRIAGPSEGLVTVMLLHLIAVIKPDVFDWVKSQIKRLNIRQYKNRILGALSAAVTLWRVYELVQLVLKEQLSHVVIDVADSILKLLFLLSFLSFLLMVSTSSAPRFFYYFFFTLAQNFTVCYIEETVSVMTKSVCDSKPFAVAYILCMALCLGHAFRKPYYIVQTTVGVSTVHFCVRIASTLYAMSKGLDKKIFSKYV